NCSRSEGSLPGSAGKGESRPPAFGKCSLDRACPQLESGFRNDFVTPAKLGASAHARSGGDGERTSLQVSVKDTRLLQLDALGALDVAFDLARDDDGVRTHAARELGAGFDRKVALDADITLEATGEANVARAFDLALDGDIGGDHGFTSLTRGT